MILNQNVPYLLSGLPSCVFSTRIWLILKSLVLFKVCSLKGKDFDLHHLFFIYLTDGNYDYYSTVIFKKKLCVIHKCVK